MNTHADSNTVTFIPAKLDYTRISKIDELIVIHFNVINCCTKHIELFNSYRPELLINLFENILECWRKNEIGYKYKASALFNEILSVCYQQNYKSPPLNSKIKNLWITF